MPPAASDKRHLLLEPLLHGIPDAVEAAIITIDGLSYATSYHPKGIYAEEDRLAPMTITGLSLSERILQVLEQGEFQHTMIAGTKGVSILVALGDAYVLMLCLRKVTSYDGFLAQLEPLLKPICNYMGVPEVRFFNSALE